MPRRSSVYEFDLHVSAVGGESLRLSDRAPLQRRSARPRTCAMDAQDFTPRRWPVARRLRQSTESARGYARLPKGHGIQETIDWFISSQQSEEHHVQLAP